MLDVPFGELARGRVQDLAAAEARVLQDQGAGVLQLVAETEGARGLVEGRSRADAAGQRLIGQPGVHHQVQRRVGRLHLQSAQHIVPAGPGRGQRAAGRARSGCRGDHARDLGLGRIGQDQRGGGLLSRLQDHRPADGETRIARRFGLGPGGQRCRLRQRSEAAEEGLTVAAMRVRGAVAGQRRDAFGVIGGERVAGQRRVQARLEAGLDHGRAAAAVGAQHQFRIGDALQLQHPRGAVRDRQPRQARGDIGGQRHHGLEPNPAVVGGEAGIAQPVGNLVNRVGILGQSQEGRRGAAGGGVVDQQRLAGAVRHRVVRPGRDLVVARVHRPGIGRALGRNMEAEVLARDDVDPGMRRLAVGGDPQDVFAPVRRKAAVAVPEQQGRAGRLGRAWTALRDDRPARFAPGRGRGDVAQTVDLFGQPPVPGVQHDPRGRDQRVEAGLADLVAPDRVDVARRVGSRGLARRVHQGLDRVLQVLHIARRAFVQDHHVMGDAPVAQELVHPQRLADDGQICLVVDAQQKDRVVARDAHGPQVGLGAQFGPPLGGRRKPKVRPDQQRGIGAEQLGLIQGDVQVAQLDLRIGPCQPQFMFKDRRTGVMRGHPVAVLGRVRDQRPEGQRDGLARRHPHAAADREDRVQRVALRPRQRGAPLEGGRVADGAAPPDEGAPVGLGLGPRRDRAFGACDQMGQVAGAALGIARPPLGHDQGAVVEDLGLDEHLRECRMRPVRGRAVQHDLAIGGDLDRLVGPRAVAQRQPAAVGMALGRGNDLEPAFDRIGGLEELGLVVGEDDA